MSFHCDLEILEAEDLGTVPELRPAPDHLRATRLKTAGTRPQANSCLLFIRPPEYSWLGAMFTPELLRKFLDVPELSSVGSAQERAAFVAIHVEGRTVREVAEALGVSKSQVPNLSSLFQTKLAAKIGELRRKRIAGSPQYKAAFSALRKRLCELAEESNTSNDVWDWNAQIKCELSREDLAECFGAPAPRFDDE